MKKNESILWKMMRLLLAVVVVGNTSLATRQHASAHTDQEETSLQHPESPGRQTIGLDGLSLGGDWDNRLFSQEDSQAPRLSDVLAAQKPQESAPVELKVEADPAIYIPGKPVELRWKVGGLKAG